MLLTNWLKSIASHCRPFCPRHHRHQRSRVLNRYQPALSRQMIGCEQLEDRTMLTSVISIDDVTVAEGDTGITDLIFTVTRTGTNVGDLNSIATVDFTTQDGTATTAEGDYSFLDGTLSFYADDSAVLQTQTISIQIHGDSLTEGNETFELLLSNNSLGTTIQNTVGTATISNDDANSISINDVTASENEAFIFEISLNEIAGSDITFLVNTLTNTADNNDYTFLTNKQVTIQAGELTTQVKLHVHDDDNQESDETFSLVISELQINGESAPSNVTIADTTGQGTILNDDGLPGSVFTIKAKKFYTAEDGFSQQMDFIVTRTGGSAGDLNFDSTIYFTTVDGTAISGEDYIEKTTTLNFSASPTATTQSFSIPVKFLGDSFSELSETVIGRISNPTNGSILKGNSLSLEATGFITNDDAIFGLREQLIAAPAYANHSFDKVGTNIAIDGDVMVIGVSRSLVSNVEGTAYVYARNQQNTPLDQTDDTWDFQTLLLSDNPQETNNFGTAVSISGDTIVIGADGESAGAIYIYTRVGDHWNSAPPKMESIKADGVNIQSYFGSSVSVYENTIVVGSSFSRSAYLFEKTGNDWGSAGMRTLIASDAPYQYGYGRTVAINDEIIIVGAPYDDDTGSNTGAAYVYTKSGNDWISNSPTETKLVASDGLANDNFGLSVATNGSEIAIGAPYTDENGSSTGSVYLYIKNGTDWDTVAPTELKISGDDGSDFFGAAISLTESQLVIGAYNDEISGINSGSAYVYSQGGAGWDLNSVTKSVLTISTNESAQFGRGIAISGSTIAAGAPKLDVDGIDSGAVYTFEKTELNNWLNTSQINPTERRTAHNAGDDFGKTMAVNENYLVIGAAGTDSHLSAVGVIYVYAKDDGGTPFDESDDNWIFETTITPPAPDTTKVFGSSVAIDNNTILVTAELTTGKSEVYIYTMNGSNWTTLDPIITPLFSTVSRTVRRELIVSIENDTIVVGNQWGNGNTSATGLVFVYTMNGSDWSTLAPTESILKASDGARYDFFGSAIDIDGDKIIVGAYENENRGAAYLYEKGVSGWNSAIETKLIGHDIQIDDFFGRSVAINGNTIFVGAPNNSSDGTASGAVYIFESITGWDHPAETKFTPTNGVSYNKYGTSIDVAGNILVVGNSTNSGSAYVYDGSSGWENLKETRIFYSSDSEFYVRGLGADVAVFGGNILISAVLDANADVNHVYSFTPKFSTIDLRVVSSPTNTLPNGETNSLPESVEWISEWSSYWVELWIEVSSPKDQGVFSAGLDFNYNTEFTSATEIEFGASFTENQAGDINDATGTIEGLFAETNVSNPGSSNYLLFARIKFEPLAEDQVKLDLSGKRIGPYDLGFGINSQQVYLDGNVPLTTYLGQFDGANIYANPYDLNDDDAINFRDLMLFASVYNTIPSESHSDYSWFADLDQNDRVNFKDLIFFASNYGKRKLDHPTIVYPQNFPHAWNNQLLVDTTQGEPQLAPETLSQSTADIVLDSVVEHVSPQLSPSQNETLEDIDIQVIDLQGDALGRAVSSTIYIDADAAGYGWFVDTTPGDNSEFQVKSQLSLIALPDTDAAGRVDLWSVIMHELGHLLGYEHEDTGLMQDTLPPGVRRLPSWELDIDLGNNSLPEEADSFFLTIQDETELVTF